MNKVYQISGKFLVSIHKPKQPANVHIEEEKLHVPHPDGGWIVDGKMTILDIEKETGIVIPTSPEYDTIGGYIFHCAGTIPSKGWKVHNDNFDLEVTASSERVIDKVLIIPSKS